MVRMLFIKKLLKWIISSEMMKNLYLMNDDWIYSASGVINL